MITRHFLVVCCSGMGVLAAQQSVDFRSFLAEFPEESDDIEIVADVDHDGDLDLIAFATLGNSAVKTGFNVRLRDPHGIWTAGPTVPLAAGSGRSVLFADVDGDTFGDLVLSTWHDHPSGPGITILPGQAGGTFGAAIHVPLPGNPTDLHKGNVNGDAAADVLVRHPEAGGLRARWLLGDPQLALTQGPSALVPVATHAAVIDADVDGVDDVAWAEDGGAAVHVWRTQPTGLVPLLTLPMTGTPARGVVAVDWENDGRDDLCAVFEGLVGANYVMYMHNHATWSVDPPLHVNLHGDVFFAGDWDGDGVKDMGGRLREAAGTTHHKLTLLRTTFGGSLGYQALTIRGADGSPTTGAGFADVNGDGHLDFVDSKAVLFGGSSFDANAGISFVSTAGLGDWEGDGDLDRGLSLRNDGRGTFVPYAFTAPPAQPTFTLLPLADTDLERDGMHEWLYERRQQVGFGSVFVDVRLHRETPTGQIVDAGVPVAPGMYLRPGIFADTDLDGDVDYVDEYGVWANNGSAFFTAPSTSLSGYRPVASADVDGDGDVDLLGYNAFGNAILSQTSPGNFSPSILAPGSVSNALRKPLLVDLDGDGDVDLAHFAFSPVGGSAACSVQVFENVGGSLVLANEWPTTATSTTHLHLTHGDLNGDGKVDLAFSNGSSNQLVVRHRVGPGLTYTQPLRFWTGGGDAVTSLDDVDQDGDLDLCGHPTTRLNSRHDGVGAGYRHQYGTGSAGTGQFRPLLSVTGPIRGGLTPSIRLRHGLGGSLGVLVVGAGENNAPSVILPGVTSYVSGLQLLLSYGLSGPIGQAGAGGFDVPVPIPPGLGGVGLFLQTLVFDPAAPSSLTFSNGCEMFIGN